MDSNPLYYAIVAALVVPLGAYMTRVFNGYRASGETLIRRAKACFGTR